MKVIIFLMKIFLFFLSIISNSVFGAAYFSKCIENNHDYVTIQIGKDKLTNEVQTNGHEATLMLGKAIADFDVEAIKFALEQQADLSAKFYWTWPTMDDNPELKYSKDKGHSALTWAIENLPSDKTLNSKMLLKDINYSILLAFILTFNLSKMYQNNKYLDTLNFLIEKTKINEMSITMNRRAEAYTPLMYAIKRKYYQVAKFLISKGADINLVTETGDSVFTYLAHGLFWGKNDIWFCNYLIEQCNDLNQLISKENIDEFSSFPVKDTTILFYLVKKYNKDKHYLPDECIKLVKNFIEMLIKNGADIYFRDSQGNLLIDDSKICDAEVKDYIIKTYELHKEEIEARKKAREKIILEAIPKTLPEALDKLIVSYLGFNNFKDDTEATDEANETLNQAEDILVKDDQNK